MSLPDISVTPGHVPGRYRPFGAIHRGTRPSSGSVALGESTMHGEGKCPESATPTATPNSPNANPQTHQ